jgi:hypothetical protein
VIFPSGERPSHFIISTATTSPSFASFVNLPGTKISFLIFLSLGATKPKFQDEVKTPTTGSFLCLIICLITASFLPLNSFTFANTLSQVIALSEFLPNT